MVRLHFQWKNEIWSKFRNRWIYMIGEYVLDYICVVAVPIFIFLFLLIGDALITRDFQIPSMYDGFIKSLGTAACLPGIAYMVRLPFQFPVEVYLRFRAVRLHGFHFKRALKVSALAYAIGYMILGPAALLILFGRWDHLGEEGGLFLLRLLGIFAIFLPFFLLGSLIAKLLMRRYAGTLFEDPALDIGKRGGGGNDPGQSS
jgi:hypothetical protein